MDRRSIQSTADDRVYRAIKAKLAAYTGEVFSGIASVGENAQVVRSIRRANDHLFYIRTVECRHLENVQDELRLLCELVLAGRCEDLLRAIHSYHDKRIEMLPTLLDLAGLRPNTG